MSGWNLAVFPLKSTTKFSLSFPPSFSPSFPPSFSPSCSTYFFTKFFTGCCFGPGGVGYMLLLVFAHGAFVMSVYAIKAGFSILYQAGSWAGPGPGPPWLGLKCYLAWGGPGWRGDIAMTWQEHGDRMTTTYHSRPREMIDATCVVEHLIFIEKQKKSFSRRLLHYNCQLIVNQLSRAPPPPPPTDTVSSQAEQSQTQPAKPDGTFTNIL